MNIEIPNAQDWATYEGFPPPHDVVEAALTKLLPDGSVIHRRSKAKTFITEPPEPIDVERFAEDVYEQEVVNLANAIYRTVLGIRLYPKDGEAALEVLADYLGRFKHVPRFINDATSRVKITEDGSLIKPLIQQPGIEEKKWVPPTEEQYQQFDTALALTIPGIPTEEPLETKMIIKEQIGPEAAELYHHLIKLSPTELQFISDLADNLLAQRKPESSNSIPSPIQ